MNRPRLLDLFCGAGGCAAGYVRAGFEVVGVDNRPQPRYLRSGASEFVQADALEFLAANRSRFAVIHASPPCQAYSCTRPINGRNDLPDLVPAVRRILAGTRSIWVIENVPGAPLLSPALVCGFALNLRVKRHRLFESNRQLIGTKCPRSHSDAYVSATNRPELFQKKKWVSVYGGGAPAIEDGRRRASATVAAAAMGIDWMIRDELSQAIPPAYTEFIGRQLMLHLKATGLDSPPSAD